MITIIVPAFKTEEKWDAIKEEFVDGNFIKPCKLTLEHSLISITKWEQKYCKPFMTSEKTNAEFIYYVKCMTLTSNVDQRVYDHLSTDNLKSIRDYMESPLTATTFNDIESKKVNRVKKKIITSEEIYYYMIQCQIPFEAAKWPLQQLMTLIHVCAAKNSTGKKMSKTDLIRRNAEINARNKALLHTKG